MISGSSGKPCGRDPYCDTYVDPATKTSWDVIIGKGTCSVVGGLCVPRIYTGCLLNQACVVNASAQPVCVNASMADAGTGRIGDHGPYVDKCHPPSPDGSPLPALANVGKPCSAARCESRVDTSTSIVWDWLVGEGVCGYLGGLLDCVPLTQTKCGGHNDHPCVVDASGTPHCM
jgi:hypothetical protein